MEILIRGLAFLFAPTIDLGCMTPLSLSFFSVCLLVFWDGRLSTNYYHTIHRTRHVVLYSFLSIVFYCLFCSFMGCQECPPLCNSWWYFYSV